MITNESGQVALVYFQPIPKLIGKYYFDTRRSISLAWVNENDVGTLLALKGGCCGGQRQIVYRATENQVKVWNTGEY